MCEDCLGGVEANNMSAAQTYYDGLLGQGYTAEQAMEYTSQHYPEFVPSMAAPVTAPMVAAPIAAAPVAQPMAQPMAAAPMAAPVAQPMMAQPMMGGAQTIVTNGGSQPSTLIAYLLWFFLGIIGVHHLYIGRGIGIFIVALLTFQGLGIWWLIDLFLIPGSIAKNNPVTQQVVIM